MSNETKRPQILIGTAGFKYDDWRGTFYPEGLPVRDQLSYYAGHFSLLELNFTYYAMPSQRTLSSLAGRTEASFTFTVKANRAMTHDPADRTLLAICRDFRTGIEPLVESGQLGAVLLQFPNSFRPNRENCERLMTIREVLGDVPVVVEFRHGDWLSPGIQGRVTGWLQEHDLGLTVVDQPQLPGLVPPVFAVTSRISYVRLHGRNSRQWYNHQHAWQRYDYSYSDQELSEWVDPLIDLAAEADTTMVVFNNHYSGNAPRNAESLRQLLHRSGQDLDVR